MKAGRPSPEEQPRRREPAPAGVAYVAADQRLSAREEAEYAHRAQAGDRSAQDRMVRANIPLVVSLANSYSSPHLESADLVQEGMIGLCTAIERFDPKKGFRFSTYATYWIRQRILRALDTNARLIHVPVDVGYAARAALQKGEELARELGREPTVAELAPHCGVTEARLEAVLNCMEDPVSLDTRATDEGEGGFFSIVDPNAPDPEQEALATEANRELHQLLATLAPRDRLVLENRFGVHGQTLSLQDLADRLRITREGVRQIQRRALDKLRRALAQRSPVSA